MSRSAGKEAGSGNPSYDIAETAFRKTIIGQEEDPPKSARRRKGSRRSKKDHDPPDGTPEQKVPDSEGEVPGPPRDDRGGSGNPSYDIAEMAADQRAKNGGDNA